MRKKILNPIGVLVVGLLLGFVSRILDLFTQNLGNIFSQMAIWILLGTILSIYSANQKKAMLHVFLFCIGMLFTYYVTAIVTDGVYSITMIGGWTIFAFCSLIFAYFAWLTKEKGFFSTIIRTGILTVSLASSIILFDRLRVYDIIINGILFYFLFFKKVKR